VTKFRHPYLTRGIVHTSTGAFAVCRGIVEAPDAIGEELGWLRIKEEHIAAVGAADSGDISRKADAGITAYA
jgi:hypothetical protein